MEQPFERADADALEEELATLPPDLQAELGEIYDTATLRGFQGAILVGGLVALLGAVLAFRLPKRKLESDATPESTVKEIVRNPTIPTEQLEMDDLTDSTSR